MNSTTRSLLFWMVLVVAVFLIWNVSSQFRTGDNSVAFSEVIRWVDTSQVNTVELTGNEIVFTTTSGEPHRTYAPPQYEGRSVPLHGRSGVQEVRTSHCQREPRAANESRVRV